MNCNTLFHDRKIPFILHNRNELYLKHYRSIPNDETIPDIIPNTETFEILTSPVRFT